MKKLRPPRIVTILIITTVTVVLWVFFTVYRILTSEDPVVIEPQLLEKLNPTLDTETLNSLQDKEFFDQDSIVVAQFSPTPTPEVSSPTPTPEPQQTEASQSATLEGNEQ